MTKNTATTTVKDGWVKREAVSGRFLSVGTGKTVANASPKSETAVREASSKRSAALKRLADR